jgi:hypothetical protein
MSTKSNLIHAMAFAAIMSVTSKVSAAPVFMANAVVASPSNMAKFDSLNSNELDLSAYREDGIKVVTSDVSYVGFDPFHNGRTTGFHYADGGNTSWVDISMADGSAIRSLDFLLGDGFGFAKTRLIWETFFGDTSTGAGNAVLNKGSTVGWTDAAGFTRLRIAANGSVGIDAFGDEQAIALDDLRINAVPEPGTLALIGWGLFGILAGRRRR